MGNLKDYATSTVASPPSPTDSGVTFTVQNGHGARFPATPFTVTAHPPDEMPTLDNAEKLLVTNVTGDTFTVTRAQGDTDAQDIVAGWRISNTVFLEDLDDVQAAAEATAESYTDSEITSAIAAVKEALYPVGSIYTNATDNTNPGTLLGFGTWSAFGAGRVMVGLNSGDSDFDTAEETGGAKTHTLTTSEIPSHTHSTPAHQHTLRAEFGATANGAYTPSNGGSYMQMAGTGAGTRASVTSVIDSGGAGTSGSAGSGGAHNNLQPYIVVYMWKRTA